MSLRRVCLAALFLTAAGCDSPSSTPCPFVLRAPASGAFLFGPSGGNGSISIRTGSKCVWYAEENALGEDWIRMSGARRTGSGDVQFTVDPASALPQLPLPRSGDINVFDNDNNKLFAVRVTQQ